MAPCQLGLTYSELLCEPGCGRCTWRKAGHVALLWSFTEYLGVVQALRSGEDCCIGLKQKDADLWKLTWGNTEIQTKSGTLRFGVREISHYRKIKKDDDTTSIL